MHLGSTDVLSVCLQSRMAGACGDCHFADSPHLAQTCGASAANISLFMTFVDLMLRSHCSIADPCTRASNTVLNTKTDRVFDFIVVGGGVAGTDTFQAIQQNFSSDLLLDVCSVKHCEANLIFNLLYLV